MHRFGNAWLAQKHNWATSIEAISLELDSYNAMLCQSMGWLDFITIDNDAPPDFQKASLPRPDEAQNVAGGRDGKLKKAVSGLKLITDWLGSGLKPVSKGLAEKRAYICRQCPQNKLGDFWQRMEGAAAAELRTLIEVKNDLDLHLEDESNLHSCMVCDCFLPLKAWVPIDHVLTHTSGEVAKELDPSCWILHEAMKVKRQDA